MKTYSGAHTQIHKIIFRKVKVFAFVKRMRAFLEEAWRGCLALAWHEGIPRAEREHTRQTLLGADLTFQALNHNIYNFPNTERSINDYRGTLGWGDSSLV